MYASRPVSAGELAVNATMERDNATTKHVSCKIVYPSGEMDALGLRPGFGTSAL